MVTFALVHGAWHDGWSWSRLEQRLGRLGHRTVSPTLPIDDVDASFGDYAADVVAALAGTEGDVVAVGHSFAGRWLHLVADSRPVALAVYLCARYPDRADQPEPFHPDARAGDLRDELGRSCWSPAGARWMYGSLPDDLAAEAATHLRPQSFRMLELPPVELSSRGSAAAILCRDDPFFTADYERWAADALLGVRPHELDGGHFPMLEQPARLATLLDELARAA